MIEETIQFQTLGIYTYIFNILFSLNQLLLVLMINQIQNAVQMQNLSCNNNLNILLRQSFSIFPFDIQKLFLSNCYFNIGNRTNRFNHLIQKNIQISCIIQFSKRSASFEIAWSRLWGITCSRRLKTEYNHFHYISV